jgi:hypothetical protein
VSKFAIQAKGGEKLLNEQQYDLIRQKIINVSQWHRQLFRLKQGEQEELLEVVFRQPEHSLWNDNSVETLVTNIQKQGLQDVPLIDIAVAATVIILEPSPNQRASLETIHSISRAVEKLHTKTIRITPVLFARDFVIAWAAGYSHPDPPNIAQSPHWERALLCIGDCMVMRIRKVDDWLKKEVVGWKSLSNNELWSYGNSISLQFVEGKCSQEGKHSHQKNCEKYHRLAAWDPKRYPLRTAIYLAVSGPSIKKGGEQMEIQTKAFAQSMLFYELERDTQLRYGITEDVYDSETNTISVKKNPWYVIKGVYLPASWWRCKACNKYCNCNKEEQPSECPCCDGKHLSQRTTEIWTLPKHIPEPTEHSSSGNETILKKQINEIQTKIDLKIRACTVVGMRPFFAQLSDPEKVLALFLAREYVSYPKELRWRVLLGGVKLNKNELWRLSERLRTAVEEPTQQEENLRPGEIGRQLRVNQQAIAQALCISCFVFPEHAIAVYNMIKNLWEKAKEAIFPVLKSRRVAIEELRQEQNLLQKRLDDDNQLSSSDFVRNQEEEEGIYNE